MIREAAFLAFWSLLVTAGVIPMSGAENGGSLFTDKVLPIFEQHCYKCHSANAEKVKGGLLLDTPEGLLKGGDTGAALTPGDPDNSRIVIAVRHTDPDLRMPPKEKLSQDQIAVIENWVKIGAPDPRSHSFSKFKTASDLWSTHPLRRPALPSTKNLSWTKDPLDAFILSALEGKNLKPVAPADKRTLIRRATFDLLGLPPTPAEIEAFVSDSSNEAFERVVNRLLESKHFGERWGRHWLDVARYADSNGLDQRVILADAWRYRDYVIEALNSDLPYNEFIREQIAGDLLPDKDNADRHRKWIATGFLVLGPKNLQEPNREKLLMDIADEQIDVMSRALLGLTVSCARCHDHKFDPIPTRDYYALAGIFRSTQTLSGDVARVPNASFLSERPLGTAEQAAIVEKYQAKLTQVERKRDRARQMARELPGGIDSKELDGIVMDNLEAEMIGEWALSNYSTNFVDKNYLHDGNEKSGKGKKSVRFRPAIPEDGFYEVRLAYTARLNRATNVPVRVETGNASKTVYLNQTIEPKYDKAFESLGFFSLQKGTNNTIEILTTGTRGYVVVDAIQCLPQDVQLAARYARKRSEPSNAETMMMGDVTAARREEYEMAIADLTAKAPPPMPMALAVREGEIKNSRVLFRGDPERAGEEVPRGFLSLLEKVQGERPGADSSGRLGLAEWIASDQNPLTSRVAVNRLWLHLFGRGLVNTPDNFGSMGEPPSNPELLDYLAMEFMTDGWSVKKMIRRLTLSATYRSSCAYDPQAYALDPENRLLWRMNRKRLEVEELRDSILSINQTLDLTIGGDGLGGVTPTDSLGGSANSLTTRRRSLYLPVFRGSLNDLYQVYDFPDPHILTGKRNVTTSATQALFLMNSPFILEESRRWSEHLEVTESESARINEIYLRAYARPCSETEQSRAETFLRNYSNALIPTEPAAEARKKKSLEALCQAIIESTEFRYLN